MYFRLQNTTETTVEIPTLFSLYATFIGWVGVNLRSFHDLLDEKENNSNTYYILHQSISIKYGSIFISLQIHLVYSSLKGLHTIPMHHSAALCMRSL